MARCPYCGAEISTPVHHSSECPKCAKPLHSCRCCTFHSPDSHYGCRESIEEPVWDKDRQNFCDYFRLTENHLVPSRAEAQAQKSRDALEKLFDF